jgi:hypothetical protein
MKYTNLLKKKSFGLIMSNSCTYVKLAKTLVAIIFAIVSFVGVRKYHSKVRFELIYDDPIGNIFAILTL